MARRRPLFSSLCLGLVLPLSGASALTPPPVMTASNARLDTIVARGEPAEDPVLARSSTAATDGRTAVPIAPAAAGAPPAITAVVLDAYRLAASVAPAGCHLDVSLLAAIGQVESGNLAGHGLDGEHRATPAVVGPVLDGTGDVRAIRDTDGGTLDGDATWDRAVGPMQFLPGTWRLAGVDLDADGLRDPQDVEDAAGAAMVYLCAFGRDLATQSGLEAAVLAYNHSTAYLHLVLAWKHAYDAYGVQLAELPALALAAVRVPSDVRSHHSDHAKGPSKPHAMGQAPATSPTPSSPAPAAASAVDAPTASASGPPASAAPTAPTAPTPPAEGPDTTAPEQVAETPPPSDGGPRTTRPPSCTEPPAPDQEDAPAATEEPTPADATTGAVAEPTTTDPPADASAGPVAAPDATAASDVPEVSDDTAIDNGRTPHELACRGSLPRPKHAAG